MKFLLQPVRRADHAGRRHRLYVVTANSKVFAAGTFDFRAIADAVATGKPHGAARHRQRAVRRFHVRVRGQGPLWPFHRWLPGAAVEATPATAVPDDGGVDKVGTFGMLRYCLPLFPDAATYFRPSSSRWP